MCVACVCADVGRVCLECGAGGSQRNPDSLRSSLAQAEANGVWVARDIVSKLD